MRSLKKYLKKLDHAGKIGIGLLIAIVAAVVVLGGIIFFASGAGTRFIHKTFDSPEKYLKYVEKEQFLGKNETSVTSIIKKAMETLDFSDKYVEEQVTVSVGEAGEKYLRMTKGSSADFSWLSNASFKYSLNNKDDVAQFKSSLFLNEKKIISPEIILDQKDLALYATVPELFKDSIKINLKELDEEVEGIFEKFGKLKEVYPDSDEVNKLISKYILLILDNVENVEREKNVELQSDEVSQKCTMLKVTLKESDMKKIAKVVLTQLSKDKEIEKMIKDSLEKLAEVSEREIDADEEYDDLMESLDRILESVEDLEMPFKITMEIYVNGNGKIIGRVYSLIPEDGEKVTFKIAAATSKKSVGYEISIKAGEFSAKLSGTGTLKGTKVTGDYVLKIGSEKVMKMEVEDFDVKALEKGRLKGHFTLTLLSIDDVASTLAYALPYYFRYYVQNLSDLISSFKPGIDVICDVQESKHTIDVGFRTNGDDIVRIAFQGSQKKGSKVKIPGKAVDITDEDALAEFTDSFDWSDVESALEDADVPKDVREAITSGFGFLKYLESSRKAKDTQVISGMFTASVSAYSTEARNLDSRETYVITIYDDKVLATGKINGDSAMGVSYLLRSFCAYSVLEPGEGYLFKEKMQSKAGKDIDYVEITIDGDTGSVVTRTYVKHPDKYSFDDISNR